MAEDEKYFRKVIATPTAASTLVVETGSGTNPDANSYITEADADGYMAMQLYTDEWDATVSADKVRALVSATRTIDANCMFKGYRKLTAQPLDWPRVLAKNDEASPMTSGAVYSPLTVGSGGGYYDSNSIPLDLAHATALQASELLKSDRTSDPSTKGISQMGLGSGALTMTFTGAESDLPKPLSDEVARMLEPLCDGFHGAGSGTRNVVRVP
jgi:hypothetical protein